MVTVAGPVPAWSDHLDRIAGMAFDWIYVNPFHYPGFSGSLYAVKDFYRLHPLMQDGGEPGKPPQDPAQRRQPASHVRTPVLC